MFRRIKRAIRQVLGLSRVRRRKVRSPRPDRANKVIISLMNKERKKRHVHTVSYDHTLMKHSRKWSRHMAHIGYLEHSDTIPENCAMVPVGRGSPASIARSCFKCWMNSPGHRAWMMQESLPKNGVTPVIHYVGFAYHIRGQYAYAALAFK